jgi:ketosteroid isomerase-like protein
MAKETLTKPAEAQVRSVIDSWAQAMSVKDAAGVVAHQARDFVQFDLAPPLRVVGADPKGRQDWFATWRGQIGYEIRDLHITVGDDVTFCHGLDPKATSALRYPGHAHALVDALAPGEIGWVITYRSVAEPK